MQRNQSATVAELSRQFGVSAVSIRRDLEHLELAGLLRRTHGGAELVGRDGQAVSMFDARLLQHVAVKQALGRAAATLVQSGDILFLDSGTTVLEVARSLERAKRDGGLTVVTRSLVIASELRCRRDMRLIVLGGLYLPDYDTFVGAAVENALRDLRVDKLFIGADGVSVDRGLTTDNLLEANLFRSMSRHADQVIVVADSSKIGVDHLQTVLGLNEVHTLVTDSAASTLFVDALHDRGIGVTLVGAPILLSNFTDEVNP